MDVNTPALLFGSISLLLLAYTNRFFVLAKLIRDLHARKTQFSPESIKLQILHLRKRVSLIKYMQTVSVISFILCAGSLFCVFLDWINAGKILFGTSVVCLLISLSFALWEIIISTNALDVILNDLDFETR